MRATLGITGGGGDNSGRINVKSDFGAVGNGTTNDTAAIQAAVASMTNGSILYFPKGDYRIATAGTAITISGSRGLPSCLSLGARLLMDNLDGSGHGTGHGILIKGLSDQVILQNVIVKWATVPSTRSFGDGIQLLGYPSDSAPAVGWTGSTGQISRVTMTNCSVVDGPNGGAVFLGCSDVTVLGFSAINTKADALHFNACRRTTTNGLHAVDNGDDGLAFVTYYHATALWQTADASR